MIKILGYYGSVGKCAFGDRPIISNKTNMTQVGLITSQKLAKNLSKQLGVSVYLKREDLHKYKSHKGRSIPFMIEQHYKIGWRNFVISSSGNAALAAGMYIDERNKKKPNQKLNLQIFVGKNIDKKKLKKNIATEALVSIVDNPRQRAFLMEKNKQAKNLRQSTDNTALEGYLELAKELSKIKNLSAVFVPTSSGTTALGLYLAFKKIKMSPQIHIIQTQSCHPMVRNKTGLNSLNKSNLKEKSIADAIVDNIGLRKIDIAEAIKNSHGNGWIAENKEIKSAIQLVKKSEDITITANGALAIVGLQKALNQGWKFSGSIACLITGS
ncbi:MAG: PLP-dependent lyase/thiolase [bacterium]